MRARNRLTNLQVKNLNKTGRYADGGGLWLQVARGGSKSWLLRYQRNHVARQMGLGPYPTISLADARDRALIALRLLVDDIDPIDKRQAERAAVRSEQLEREEFETNRVTFAWCAERYICDKSPEWKNKKHIYQWRQSLEVYAYPVIGNMPVADIGTAQLLKLLQRQIPKTGGDFWTTMPETASRTRGRIESILGWATVKGYRTGDNPARLSGHLGEVLPKLSKVHKVVHQPSLPYVEMPMFMMQLQSRIGVTPLAIQFTILTAARTGEVIGAKWDEIDLFKAIWTIPGERTKTSKEQRVPLSSEAVKLLERAPREGNNDYLFIGAKAGNGLSNMSMLKLLKEMRPGLVVHGFRSTFRDWAAETTNFPRELCEAALGHQIGGEVERAYQRGDLLEKRRKLMSAWAKYAYSKPVSCHGVVVPLGRRTANG